MICKILVKENKLIKRLIKKSNRINNNINNKKGNSLILITFFIFFIVIFCIILLFITSTFQVWVNTSKIKSDLFYIVNNSYITFNNKELSYNNYVVNREYMKFNIEKLLNSNTSNNVIVEQLNYTNNNVYVKVKTRFKPLLKINNNEYIYITIEDNIKLKMLEVENE